MFATSRLRVVVEDPAVACRVAEPHFAAGHVHPRAPALGGPLGALGVEPDLTAELGTGFDVNQHRFHGCLRGRGRDGQGTTCQGQCRQCCEDIFRSLSHAQQLTRTDFPSPGFDVPCSY